MNDYRKLVLFAALIYAYVVAIWLCDIPFRLFTSRSGGGLGIDSYLLSAWAACFWRGPHTFSAFDPHPFRSTAVFIGVLGMALSLGAKLAVRFLLD
ncbi:MAG: hypothetical protein EOM72_04845 [Opitutae bacterium]|nr:hypothetical protein [Opitutae bacterium]